MSGGRQNRGCVVFDEFDGVRGADAGVDLWLRRLGEKKMSGGYLISGVIALGLLVYLVVALLRAEDL